MAKVILNTPITTDRYGLHFDKGEAYTNNEYLINKLIKKGVKVEIENPDINSNDPEKTMDEMTIAELRKYATENNIEIPSNVRNKTDIIEFITNYKKDDEEQKDLKTNEEGANPDTKLDSTGEEGANPDTKLDSTGEEGANPDINSNNSANGEESNKADNEEEPKAE